MTQCIEITSKGKQCKKLSTSKDLCGLCSFHYNLRLEEGTLNEICPKKNKRIISPTSSPRVPW